MYCERMDEIIIEQNKINNVLIAWDKSMDEAHYYSLKNTIQNMLDYVMGVNDFKPAVNPLVETYLRNMDCA